MIVSMTGYGKSACQLEEKNVTVEIRTLNSKNLDLNIKVPGIFREKENLVRNILGSALERGKVELVISVESSSATSNTIINKQLLMQFFNEMNDVAHELKTELSENIFPALLRLPEVLQLKDDEIVDDEWSKIESTIMDAIEQVKKFRLSEGNHLQNDIEERLKSIERLLFEIEPFEKSRIHSIKDKILRSIKELNGSVKIDENRFEQELIFYLEKLDITEEKVRLKKHLDYFTETIRESDTGGKKLGFIVQEIGREINTIGSKANDADIQKIVVQMKDELEKIKEQLMNVL
jgi:uncharacterized protein (TIGR00255 family)